MDTLGWDITNFIFSHLDPREIILVATSINNNFCKNVRSQKYSDHLRMINKDDFVPDGMMLNFHVTKRTTHEDEGYYVKLCAKESRIDLADKMFSELRGHPGYISQHYEETTGFSKRNRCYIGRCANGFDKIVTRIRLPTLPEGIEYQPIVHNLFRSIELTICGTTIFRFTSRQLRHSDSVSLLFSNSVIYLYVDLNQMIERGFAGIRTSMLEYQQVLFSVQLHDIFSIIKNDISTDSRLRAEIGNLKTDGMYALVRFHEYNERFLRKPTTQTVTTWNSRRYRITKQDSLKIKCAENVPVKRILLCFDRNVQIKKCAVIIHDHVSVDLVRKDDAVTDEYIFGVDVNPRDLIIELVDALGDVNVDVHFETVRTITHYRGIMCYR